ncbi:MAG TPA: aryl-sulfate sulfotransferase [Methylomirabilota bacterium]|nr:aryl-sulfate sulfotransferase [Methylomirabilota bacterium]
MGENEDGSPRTLPGQLGILTRKGGQWEHRTFEDTDNNVFHKVVPFGSDGFLTFGGTRAGVKLWHTNGLRELLWEADFGGQFSRMRDAEVGHIYGDGKPAVAIATHDHGVVAVLRRDESGAFKVHELDRQPETVVHEIEIGDLNGDGVPEIYATPTAPNRVDGTPQPGKVVRYVPAKGEGRTVVADLGDRHAKEILVTDLDDDGRDELYVSVEAVSGGRVEIRRYLATTAPTQGELVVTLDDTLCRFLTVGDVDGNGTKEMVAAANKSGLWLLRPYPNGPWDRELIDANSGGFEHASILLDLDGDERDELYVASDNQREVRRYEWTPKGWRHEVLLRYTDKLNRLTWNITAVPTTLLPAPGATLTDTASAASFTKIEPVRAKEPPPPAVAQTPDKPEKPVEPRGLRLNSNEAEPGYVIYAPLLSDTTYLIDAQGAVVHTWKSDYSPSGTVYLMDNGNLLRGAREPKIEVFKGGGQGGRFQEFSWDGKLLWDWKYATTNHLLHHDIEPLPNGNILAIAWEAKSAKEANRVGRRPDLTPQAGLWPDKIIEIEPHRPDGGRIVWEWHMWDHLIQNYDPEKANYGDPARHPELIDINGDADAPKIDAAELARLKALGYVPADAKQGDISSDLLHINAIAYNAELDQIALSTPRFNEIWIIDHSTTTAEAAGHTGGRWKKGGGLLYRWGNPKAYSRGTKEHRIFGGQHDVRWIEKGFPGAGHLMVFNNNARGPGGPYSTVLELVPPTHPDGSYVIPEEGPIGPSGPYWQYEAPDKKSFHSGFISGARRLPGGNTLICSGADGRIFEVTKEGKIVWEYWDPFSGNVRAADGGQPQPVGKHTYAVFRAAKVPPQHPALAGRSLRPLNPQPRPALDVSGP